MEIKKLFDRGSASSSTQTARNSQQIEALRNQAQQGGAPRGSEDSVTISSLSRQLSQLSAILTDDEAVQQKRVTEIKRAVEDGSYNVDSSAVARSLISNAADSEGII